MKQVGIFDAKTHLSSLIDQVEKGGEVVITRHGKPVARLVQAEHKLTPVQLQARKKALQELWEFGRRLNLNLTREEIKRRIEEGRH
jgi:prevent-host-death family protein